MDLCIHQGVLEYPVRERSTVINELYELARVLDDAQVKRQSWHPKIQADPHILAECTPEGFR